MTTSENSSAMKEETPTVHKNMERREILKSEVK